MNWTSAILVNVALGLLDLELLVRAMVKRQEDIQIHFSFIMAAEKYCTLRKLDYELSRGVDQTLLS